MPYRLCRRALAVVLLFAPTLATAAPLQRLVIQAPGLPEHDHRPAVITAVAISQEGSRLAIAGDNHRITVWDAGSGKLTHTVDTHSDWVRSLRFSSDGGRLASVSADRSLRVWDLSAAPPREASRRLAGGALQAVAWRGDQTLVTVGFGDRLRLFRPGEQPPTDFPCACEDTRAVACSPEGRWIAAAGRNGVLRVWDQQQSSGRPRDLPSDGRRIRALAFSPDGRTLAAGGDGPAVRLWRIEAGDIGSTPDELLIRPGKVHALSFTDETTLAIGGTQNAIGLWNTDTWMREASLTGHTGTVAALAVNAQGSLLVSGSFDTTVRVWEIGPAAAAPTVASTPGATPAR